MAYARLLAGPNRVVITENYKIPAYRSKHTVTPVANGTQAKPWSLAVNGTNPMLAFVGVNNATLSHRAQSGNTFTFHGFGSGGSFTAMVFDEPNFGQRNYFVVTNPETNETMFDATLKQMKVKGMLIGRADLPPEQRPTLTLPAGRTYAALAGSVGAMMQAIGGFIAGSSDWLIDVAWRKGIVNIDGNVASIGTIDTARDFYRGTGNNPQPPPGTYGNPWVRSPILDVTGY